MYNITTLLKRSDNRLFHRIWFFCFDIKPHTSNVAQGPKSRTIFESEGLSCTSYVAQIQSTTVLLFPLLQMKVIFQIATRHSCRTAHRLFLNSRYRANIT